MTTFIKTDNIMITHNQLMRYMALQYIGHVNMNDLEKVRHITDLTYQDIRYIQENYQALTEEHLPKGIRDIINAIPITDYPLNI